MQCIIIEIISPSTLLWWYQSITPPPPHLDFFSITSLPHYLRIVDRKRVSQIVSLILRQVERVMIRGMEIHRLLVVVVAVLLSLVLNGEGGITSSYVRSEWPAVDIPLDHKVFKVPKGYNAPQQVSPLLPTVFFI